MFPFVSAITVLVAPELLSSSNLILANNSIKMAIEASKKQVHPIISNTNPISLWNIHNRN